MIVGGKNYVVMNDLRKIKVGLVSLGCDKNRVDSEKLLAKMSEEFEITSDIMKADVLVINSCAFLTASRKEALDAVFEYAELKKVGKLKKIILAGCLPQKFIGELFDELVEVDAFLGTFDGTMINEAVRRALAGERCNFVGKGEELGCERVLTTPEHYAYLKISDGCSNHCTYCLIPKIRGALRSRPVEELVKETKLLGDVEELVLVAQDVTRYGEDIYGRPQTVRLIKELTALENVRRVRLLYCYPELMTDELINELKTNEKLVKYVDMPLQHASDRILKLMNRKGTGKGYLELIKKLRKEVKGIALRSTFIAGFPTETEEDFDILVDFLKKAELNNAGFFAYSKEPDTAAYKLKGHLTQSIKNARVKKLYAVQREISAQLNRKYVGKEIIVVADGIDYDRQEFFGRTYFHAPDVDGKVYLTGDGLIEQGKTYLVKVTASDDYDLYGTIIKEITQ